MSGLTAFGLMLDLIGAIFITISDPLRFPSRILGVRYWFDQNYPPVSLVKEGYRSVRRGDIYKSEEARVDEQVDPDPDTPQGHLNNLNRLDRTETNPKLVERFYQIARLTEGGDNNLLTEGYQTPVLINSDFILYKISHTGGIGTDSVSTIDFVHVITGPSRLMEDEDEYVYSVPEDAFRDDLVEYINGVYLRTGLYLLMIGFFLQTLDILITEIAIRL